MPRRRPEDGRIDWTRGRRALFDWVRALTHPYPGAFTELAGRRLFVWRAETSRSPAFEARRLTTVYSE
jgi:methionyl-tRNA formyltransferase